MKKYLLSVLLLCAVLCIHAQSWIGKLSITPKVGLNVATMTNTDDSDPRCGLVIGADAEYPVDDILGISIGAFYSQQGVKGDYYDEVNGVDVNGDVTIRMDYINVPVLANFHVFKGLAVEVGLQPGFKVNSQCKVSANGKSATFDLGELFEAAGTYADIKSIDLSIPVGISYVTSNIKFDVRYNFGVSKALSVDGESARNSVFQFTVGYKFAL